MPAADLLWWDIVLTCPLTKHPVFPLTVHQVNIHRLTGCQHLTQTGITGRTVLPLHKQRQSASGVPGQNTGIAHTDRQLSGIKTLPCRINLPLKSQLLLRTGILFLHPLFGIRPALIRCPGLNAQCCQRVQTRRLYPAGARHQCLITPPVLLTQSPPSGLLLQRLRGALCML